MSATPQIPVAKTLQYVDLYLMCHEPRALVFAASDDERMIDKLRAHMRVAHPYTPLVWRDALRSKTQHNAGVHAVKLNLTHFSSRLGASHS